MEWWLIPLIGALTYLALTFKPAKPHPNEPPTIPQTIPFVGHLIGMFFHGQNYYTKMSALAPNPIYTLRVMGKPIYVVNSPSLIAAADRNSKAISFDPYVVEFSKRISTPTEEGLSTIAGHIEDNAACVRAALAPGDALEETTISVLESVRDLLSYDSAVINEVKGTTVDLFAWIKGLVTKASTDGIYGAQGNPFRDPKIEAAFWAVDKDFIFLGLDILPSLLAPKASAGRDTLYAAFKSYYASNKQTTASRLIKSRLHTMGETQGMSTDDIARLDLGVCYALLTNTVPTTAWGLFHIYSRPKLLSDLRAQLSHHITTSSSGKNHLNLAAVVSKIPLFTSLVHETLRIQSTNASGRVVLKDTWLSDSVFLKKDSVLLVPSAGIHHDPSVWGPEFATFDAQRFLNKGSKVPGSAYRAFGGGAAVCPGRYFATNEVVMILAMMVCMYDVLPAGGEWGEPVTRPHITTSILTPVGGVGVRIERRGREEWGFGWDRV